MNTRPIDERIKATCDLMDSYASQPLVLDTEREQAKHRLDDLLSLKKQLLDLNKPEPENDDHLIFSHWSGCDGPFNMKTGKLSFSNGLGPAHLCFKENVNIRFAKITLHEERANKVNREQTWGDAARLGAEICRRWNMCSQA